MNLDFALVDADFACCCFLQLVFDFLCRNLDRVARCIGRTRGGRIVIVWRQDTIALDHLNLLDRQLQYSRCNLCHDRGGAHTVLITADENFYTSVAVIANNGLCSAQRRVLLAADCTALAALPDRAILLRRLVDLNLFCASAQALFYADRGNLFAVAIFLTVLDEVLRAQLDWAHAELVSQLVHHALHTEFGLWATKATERANRHGVGDRCRCIHVDIINIIHADRTRGRQTAGIGDVVLDRADLFHAVIVLRNDAAILGRTELDAAVYRPSCRCTGKLLLAGVLICAAAL